MALSLIQESLTGKGLAGVARHHGLSHCIMKEEDRSESLPSEATNNNNTTSPGFSTALLGSSHLFPSALMSPLNLHESFTTSLSTRLFQANPLLHWAANRMATTHVTSSKKWTKRRKKEEPVELTAPPSPPTSGSSPQSNGSVHDVITSKTTDKGGREKVFVCRICNHSFGYKHVLQNHERTHTGEKPFECPECHRRFTRDHHLKIHMRLHTGEKPYHCPHCDKHFVQVANLRRHLRVHTGERPYACQLCSSRFSDSNQLKAHTLIHRGEKPFECGSCGVRFRRRHHLLHHKCHGSDPEDIGADCEEDYDDEIPKKSRERKSRDVRRVIREPLLTIPVILPEQTEPEDLSMSARQKNNNNNSGTGESDEDMHESWVKNGLYHSPSLS